MSKADDRPISNEVYADGEDEAYQPKITVRVPRHTIGQLDDLDEYHSRSEAVRDGIQRVLDDPDGEWSTDGC